MTKKTTKKASKKAAKKASKKTSNRKIDDIRAIKTEEEEEAKRQDVKVIQTKASIDDGGSHSIDHGTILDDHIMPDTIKEGIEDIQEREANDLSFWGNSWTWVKSERAYGDKPQDKWFVNPTVKLIGEVMQAVPLVYGACRVALQVGDHQEQGNQEYQRHLDFLRGADQAELVSECLDMLTAYQARFFESVQRYIGLAASYDNQVASENSNADRIGDAAMKKKAAGDVCRGWAARLIALVEAYHEVVTDERAYNLQYKFDPVPGTSQHGLFKWSVTQALNKVGRRLARSIKTGGLDAEKYRIPRPWTEEAQKGHQVSANTMIGDFN